MDTVGDIDCIHFVAMCSYLRDHPVRQAEMVEVKRDGRSSGRAPRSQSESDLPAPANQPQTVLELAAMLNSMGKR